MPGRTTPRAIAGSIAACLILAAPAAGSTIDIEPNTILGGDAVVYRAVPGELNTFFVLDLISDQIRVRDPGVVGIVPSLPCVVPDPADPSLAQCPVVGITGVAAFLGDGADSGSGPMPTIPALIDGQEDDDRLSGGFDGDLLLGGAGADRLFGEEGNDVLDGGPGADQLSGDNGFAGGTGFDVADYADRLVGVTVSLDGLPNDGEPGEGDLLTVDMDGVNGGFAGDALTGDDNDNFLAGNDGNDTLEGRGGSDFLDGGNGDDTIQARDGIADGIDCGAGVDTVTADAVDATAGCEVVSVPAPPAAAPVPAPAVAPVLNPRDVTAPALALRRIVAPRLRTALRRGLTVRLACSEACTLRGVAVFRGRTVARGTGSGAAGVTRAVKLRFSSTAAKALRRLRTARLTLRLTAADASGNRRTVTRSLTLRR